MVYRESLPLSMIVLMFAIAIYAGPMVETNAKGEIISHWDFSGNANGYMEKTAALFILPIITLFIYLAFLLIPKIDVYAKNIEHFAQQFWGFRVIFVFVMLAIYIASILPNLGYWNTFDPLIIIIPAIALLFFYVGYMLNFTKRNFFIGVRTPWTISDERVWEKTNRLAGKLFWICGALTFVALLAPSDARLWLVLVPAILVAIGVSVYSYFEYRKVRDRPRAAEKKKAKKKR